MATSRKQVISQLAEMEKKLEYHQSKMEENTTYLLDLFGETKIALISILVPSFILGWTAARPKRGKPLAKRLMKFGLLSTLTHFRKALI